MKPHRGRTVSAINEFVESQKAQAAEDGIPTELTAWFFNSEVTPSLTRTPINQVPPLTVEGYRTGGTTALCDAVGEALNAISRQEETSGTAIKPKIVVAIVTDGEENDSKRFKKSQILEMISRLEAKQNYTVVYLGANVDAWSESSTIGVAKGNTSAYNVEHIGEAMRDLGMRTRTLARSADYSTKNMYGGGNDDKSAQFDVQPVGDVFAPVVSADKSPNERFNPRDVAILGGDPHYKGNQNARRHRIRSN
jgi:hypothetical protein